MNIAYCLTAALAGPYEEGVAALKAGDLIRARTLLAAAKDAEPERVEPAWELGWACWSADDFACAAAAWESVAAIRPTHLDVDFWLAAAKTRNRLASIPRSLPAIDSVASTGDTLRVIAAGDTMMGSDLKRGPAGLPPDDGKQLFADVAPVLSAGDVTFLNLEGPLADDLTSSKCGPTSTSCYAFRTPTRFATNLVSAGVDVVSLANNHAFDLGPAGQSATMKALDAVGIRHAGRYGDVATVVAAGKRVAVVAAHSGSCCLNVNRIPEVQAAILEAGQTHDLVIFSFHGGAEGSAARHVPGKLEVAWGEERGDVRALARAAVDAGADLVIGHGPHVLRAMEVYRGRLIAYSLGNFVGYAQFGTGGGHTGNTVIVDAELAPNGVLLSARLHAVRLDDKAVPKLQADGEGLQHVRELSAADFPESGVRVAEDGTLSW